ncbi:hypothetical protein [Kitasatospora sp. MAP5-34]|uniref:hypothetical protein n=1 Tax=Kitasatospora sp. MAP5-34 TaxID=3035102 RepID=UPI0024760782|nr:hypothetical protein [Kitasatospora sp. MAP5-34]MDH6579509.1 hypothetical protein [Kitasatospora sp. MAP5-34]
MLNPVDLPTVFAEDLVHGRHRAEIHPGVAWWVGSCLVLVTRSHGVALVHDGTELAKEYTGQFCRGAVNCQHYAATISVLGEGGEDLLAYAIRTLQVPGALITTVGAEVTIRLFAADGTPISEGTGLERICDLIARDKVPIPVNDTARGRVVHRPDIAQHFAASEG